MLINIYKTFYLLCYFKSKAKSYTIDAISKYHQFFVAGIIIQHQLTN